MGKGERNGERVKVEGRPERREGERTREKGEKKFTWLFYSHC